MEAVFIHGREDRRQFGDLMAERIGIISGEVLAALPASWRLALDALTDVLGRDQGPDMTNMPGLPAPLLARRGRGRPSLDRGRIG